MRASAARSFVVVPLLGLATLAAALSGCSSWSTAARFATVGDLARASRSDAEGGHGAPALPPPGIRWSSTLTGLAREATTREPARSAYELYLTVVDDAAADAVSFRAIVDPAVFELVDDDGRRFPCTRAQIPDEVAIAEEGDDEPPLTRHWILTFDLPATYRFRTITNVTVHWDLAVDGAGTLPLSTRFSSART